MSVSAYMKQAREDIDAGVYDGDIDQFFLMEQLQFEIDRLRFALTCSIGVTDVLLETIDTMNVVGKRFGFKPLKPAPPPAFIKQILEGSGT